MCYGIDLGSSSCIGAGESCRNAGHATVFGLSQRKSLFSGVNFLYNALVELTKCGFQTLAKINNGEESRVGCGHAQNSRWIFT